MNTSSVFGLLAAEMSLASAISAGIVLTLVVRAQSPVKGLRSADPQHIHVGSTPRLGGVGVYVGFVVAVAIALQLEFIPPRPVLSLLIAALPVQLVGLWEDITHRVSPRNRLLAAVFSAALASVIAQGIITRLDLPFVDRWLAFLPFAVPLTWFMVAGACNAFNIIDGTNGLAGGSAVLMFAGMAIVAWHTGDTLVLVQATAMTGALVGFLLWNYPKGKVFLGDAGAYFIGFMYALLAIHLVARNPGVSAWFVIALAAYPIFETLFSIYRRKVVRRAAAMQPDIRHLHSLLYLYFLRAAERPPREERRRGHVEGAYRGKERRQPQRRANARVAPRLWLHGALCFAAALLYHENTPALIGFTLIYGIFYWICYRDAERLNGENTMARRTISTSGDSASPEIPWRVGSIDHRDMPRGIRPSAVSPDRAPSAETTRQRAPRQSPRFEHDLVGRRALLQVASTPETVRQLVHDLRPDESLVEGRGEV